ncbi:hypothetical protein F5882DRAFT_378054 [Hyaloscypha sp. PMI_1271]|nr:hypothetical protein F5882DRAFT_378054 [Hyaloscypha sp. PMI_1271]
MFTIKSEGKDHVISNDNQKFEGDGKMEEEKNMKIDEYIEDVEVPDNGDETSASRSDLKISTSRSSLNLSKKRALPGTETEDLAEDLAEEIKSTSGPWNPSKKRALPESESESESEDENEAPHSLSDMNPRPNWNPRKKQALRKSESEDEDEKEAPHSLSGMNPRPNWNPPESESEDENEVPHSLSDMNPRPNWNSSKKRALPESESEDEKEAPHSLSDMNPRPNWNPRKKRALRKSESEDEDENEVPSSHSDMKKPASRSTWNPLKKKGFLDELQKRKMPFQKLHREQRLPLPDRDKPNRSSQGQESESEDDSDAVFETITDIDEMSGSPTFRRPAYRIEKKYRKIKQTARMATKDTKRPITFRDLSNPLKKPDPSSAKNLLLQERGPKKEDVNKGISLLPRFQQTSPPTVRARQNKKTASSSSEETASPILARDLSLKRPSNAINNTSSAREGKIKTKPAIERNQIAGSHKKFSKATNTPSSKQSNKFRSTDQQNQTTGSLKRSFEGFGDTPSPKERKIGQENSDQIASDPLSRKAPLVLYTGNPTRKRPLGALNKSKSKKRRPVRPDASGSSSAESDATDPDETSDSDPGSDSGDSDIDSGNDVHRLQKLLLDLQGCVDDGMDKIEDHVLQADTAVYHVMCLAEKLNNERQVLDKKIERVRKRMMRRQARSKMEHKLLKL